MSFAAQSSGTESDVRFNVSGNEVIRVPRACKLTGIDPTDRQVLSDWLDDISGIDTVIDLAPRPWNIPGVHAIIGVFETGSDQASWLIIRQPAGWTLARCSDGFISDDMVTLRNILALIDRQRRG